MLRCGVVARGSVCGHARTGVRVGRRRLEACVVLVGVACECVVPLVQDVAVDEDGGVIVEVVGELLEPVGCESLFDEVVERAWKLARFAMRWLFGRGDERGIGLTSDGVCGVLEGDGESSGVGALD